MALVSLPSSPGPQVLDWYEIDFGGTLRGPLGGTAQRINRLGNRWGMTFRCPAMSFADAREWSAALSLGLKNGVSCRVRQPGLNTGSPGTVLVAGAGQSGFALDVDGMNPGYPVRRGQWMSLLTGGRRYLYLSGDHVAADGSGTATLALTTALRAEPADNDPVTLGAPVIEGLLVERPGWSLDPRALAGGFTFTIEEVA